MTNLDIILKSRDITLPTSIHLVKAMIFLVVMYGCESWTIKKSEHQSIDSFELWSWGRLLRVPWAARRSNLKESILKEINPESSLEGWCWSWNSNTLATWFLRKDPDVGKDWRQKEKGMIKDEMVEWHHWLNGHEFEQAQVLVMDGETWHATVHGVSKSWLQPSYWTEMTEAFIAWDTRIVDNILPSIAFSSRKHNFITTSQVRPTENLI